MIIRAADGVDSLSALAHRRMWRAENGRHGSGANRHGRGGRDLLVCVPPGTLVRDTHQHFVMKDLVRPGDEVVAARGGKGGFGNTRFKSATQQAPRQCTPGEDGERRFLTLELKVIADVGLIGKPNAGKSTLLSRLSHARPEIADYPFTTKVPQLGRVQIDADRSFVLADIPGLVEGAHLGVGLGHAFLRHIERAGLLVHLVEPTPLDGTDPVANYHSVRHELQEYKTSLGAREEIVAVTKAELPGADDVYRQLQGAVPGPLLLISAVTGQGLNRLIQAIAGRLPPPAARLDADPDGTCRDDPPTAP